jgi:hypothetical protein
MCVALGFSIQRFPPSTALRFRSNYCETRDSSRPCPAHYALPVPPSGPSAHPKPSTNNIPTAIPSFRLGASPSSPSSGSTIPSERSSRRSSTDSYPHLTDNTHLSTPRLHSDVSSPTNSMCSVTSPDPTLINAKIVSPAGSNMEPFIRCRNALALFDLDCAALTRHEPAYGKVFHLQSVPHFR